MESLGAISHTAWRKPSRSIANGDCVETASRQGEILVRDSKALEDLILQYPAGAWRAFVRELQQCDRADPGAILNADDDEPDHTRVR